MKYDNDRLIFPRQPIDGECGPDDLDVLRMSDAWLHDGGITTWGTSETWRHVCVDSTDGTTHYVLYDVSMRPTLTNAEIAHRRAVKWLNETTSEVGFVGYSGNAVTGYWRMDDKIAGPVSLDDQRTWIQRGGIFVHAPYDVTTFDAAQIARVADDLGAGLLNETATNAATRTLLEYHEASSRRWGASKTTTRITRIGRLGQRIVGLLKRT